MQKKEKEKEKKNYAASYLGLIVCLICLLDCRQRLGRFIKIYGIREGKVVIQRVNDRISLIIILIFSTFQNLILQNFESSTSHQSSVELGGGGLRCRIFSGGPCGFTIGGLSNLGARLCGGCFLTIIQVPKSPTIGGEVGILFCSFGCTKFSLSLLASICDRSWDLLMHCVS